MFRLPPFASGLAASISPELIDLALMGQILRPTGGGIPRHRSPGGRAHRRWR